MAAKALCGKISSSPKLYGLGPVHHIKALVSVVRPAYVFLKLTVNERGRRAIYLISEMGYYRTSRLLYFKFLLQ